MFRKSCYKCLRHSYWENDTLYYTNSKCKKPIAIRYQFNEEVRIYPYRRFKKYKRQIEQRKDTYQIASESNLLGNVDFGDFKELCDSVRYYSEQLSPLPKNEEWIQKNSESEDSYGIGEIYQIEDYEYITKINDENEMEEVT